MPEGFTPLFNGRDLTGWHISTTNHHGTTPSYRVMHGLIVGSQNPLGQGGILLTDRKYKNVELYTEVKPDYGCDSGLFFRSNEAGDAYQVTMDYLPGGGDGGHLRRRSHWCRRAGTRLLRVVAQQLRRPHPRPHRRRRSSAEFRLAARRRREPPPG